MPPKKKEGKGKGKGKPVPKLPSKTSIEEGEIKPPVVRTISKPKPVTCTNQVPEDAKPCPSECNCYKPLDIKDPEYGTKPEFIYGGPFSQPPLLNTPSAYAKENEAIKSLDLFKFRKRLVNPITSPKKPPAKCRCTSKKGTCICEPIRRSF